MARVLGGEVLLRGRGSRPGPEDSWLERAHVDRLLLAFIHAMHHRVATRAAENSSIVLRATQYNERT